MTVMPLINSTLFAKLGHPFLRPLQPSRVFARDPVRSSHKESTNVNTPGPGDTKSNSIPRSDQQTTTR